MDAFDPKSINAWLEKRRKKRKITRVVKRRLHGKKVWLIFYASGHKKCLPRVGHAININPGPGASYMDNLLAALGKVFSK